MARKLKQQPEAEPTTAIGVIELAKIAGVTRQTIKNWRECGCPQPLTIESVIKWLAEERQRINRSAVSTTTAEEADAKTKQIELQNQKLQIQIDKMKELLVEPEKVQANLITAFASLRNALQAIGDKYNETININKAINDVVLVIKEIN